MDKKKQSPPPPASAAKTRRAPCSRKNCAVGAATSSSTRDSDVAEIRSQLTPLGGFPSVWYETSSKSHGVKSQKRAFRTSTRLPPKVTRQVSKTSVSYETSPKVTRQVSKTTVSYETSSKSHTSSLQNERFVRDFLQKSRCEAARRAFRTRLPPKVTRQVSKTSVSYEYETSSKSHTSSLQNERFVRDFPKSHASSLKNDRFVRDFLQKSHVESPKRAFRTRLPPKVTLRGCKTSVSYETSSKSHASSLKNERFVRVRDFLQKSHVKSPKRAFRTRLPQKSRVKSQKRPFRTRLPPKVTRRVSKTSVSYETSSKSHAARLQDERFVRDFLQKSRVKSQKRAFRTRLPPKVTRQVSKTSVSYETSSKSPAETPIGAHTSRSPA